MCKAVYLVILILGSQAVLMQSAVGQPSSPPPPPLLADCPIKWIGEIGGLHQYETIDCADASTTGFGESEIEYTTSQCSGATCLNPVQAILRGLKNSAATTDCGVTTLDEAKERVRTGIRNFAVWQSRYAWSDSYYPDWLRQMNANRVLWQEYLYSSGPDDQAKVDAFNAAYCEGGSHALADDLATRNWGLRGIRKLKNRNVDDLWPLLDDYPAQVSVGAWSYTSGGGNWRPIEEMFLRARGPSGAFVYFQYVEMRRAGQRFYIAFEMDGSAVSEESVTTVHFVETGSYRHLINVGNKTVFATTVADLTP